MGQCERAVSCDGEPNEVLRVLCGTPQQHQRQRINRSERAGDQLKIDGKGLYALRIGAEEVAIVKREVNRACNHKQSAREDLITHSHATATAGF